MMSWMVRLLMPLLFAAVTLAHAQEVRPGDQVRFVARDQHIPAHPAPGDSRVHLRFVSGSAATVLPTGSLNGQQNTGFAFKRGLMIVRRPDATALDIRGDGRLRYGARIDVTRQGQTFQLLSVHLKSGGFEHASASSDCAMLLEQIPVLEGWIDEAARGLCRLSCSGTSTAGSPSRATGSGPTSTTATHPTQTSRR